MGVVRKCMPVEYKYKIEQEPETVESLRSNMLFQPRGYTATQFHHSAFQSYNSVNPTSSVPCSPVHLLLHRVPSSLPRCPSHSPFLITGSKCKEPHNPLKCSKLLSKAQNSGTFILVTISLCLKIQRTQSRRVSSVVRYREKDGVKSCFCTCSLWNVRVLTKVRPHPGSICRLQ